MNLSINTGTSTAHRNFKLIFIAGAGALVSAAVLVLNTGALKSPSPVTRHPINQAAFGTTASVPSVNPNYVYYIVGTDDQAAQMRGILSSESAAYGSPIATVIVDTPANRELVSMATAELTRVGAYTQVLDLTESPSMRVAGAISSPVDAAILAGIISSERAAWAFPAPGADGLSLPLSVSDADLMTGVISSERAEWAFDDDQPSARSVSDADLMAGVISSERAAWAFPPDAFPETGR